MADIAHLGILIVRRTLLCLPSLLASAALLLASVCAAVSGAGRAAAQDENPRSTGLDLSAAQLLCDPDVGRELQLTPAQTDELRGAYRTIEQPLWLVRDAARGEDGKKKRDLLATFVPRARDILQPAQRARLDQLTIRSFGWPVLATPEVSKPLGLSTEQLVQIEKIVRQMAAETISTAKEASDSAAREGRLVDLRRAEGESIQKLLSDAQRQKLAEMVGQPYDFSTVRPLTFAAPELEHTEGWFNSKPLKLSDVRGKVVAFHFWAFNCVNCVHNLPHYNAWHRKFASRGLIVIGMHTPETAAERDRSAVEAKIREHQI
ncbi:MAG TPA: redoxin domain-containing protein, partial [Pirellulales bacterium]|nr:redoxin domain-containing protein [Pirellulales bacterium]